MINLMLLILFIIHAGYSMEGGSLAKPGEFTYIASIQERRTHLCSGVMVHEKYIITVAHSMVHVFITNLRVNVGKTSTRLRDAVHYPVKEIYFHPEFRRRILVGQWDNVYYEHDIAVLRLERSWIRTLSVPQVSLAEIEHDWGHNFDCALISWNAPRDNRKAKVINWQWIKSKGNEIHQQWAMYLGTNQKFFGDYFETIAIGVEDLGSPIICGDLMAGLVVKGEQSEIPGKPSIAMSIVPYLEFIDDIINDGLFDVDREEFPYVASIWYNGTYVCGGFIIDHIHVATAGHCIETYEMADFAVSVGYPLQWLSVVAYTIHPNYKVEIASIPPNWYINHDFVILTLGTSIQWNERTSPLPLTESDDFHVGQVCEVLRWKRYKDRRTGAKFIRLRTSHVIILNNECSQPQLDLSPELQVPSFWAKSRYLIPIADHRDAGNPIICDGNPVGFLIQAIPYNGKSTGVLARFLKIRPYIEFRNTSWFHDAR